MTACAAVFGGTKGIGAAISKLFFRNGFNVAVVSRDKNNVDLCVTDIGPKNSDVTEGNRLYGASCDVTNEEDVVRTVDQIREQLGPIQVLVNAAGINQDQIFLKTQTRDIEHLLRVNLVGSMTTSRIALKQMLKQRNGCIINIGSIVGLKGNVGQTAYSASKAALIGFTKSLAKEVAPRNIRVNCICPGYIETDMTRSLRNKELIIKQIPLLRMGDPEDVAQLALFLVNAKYITGQSLVIDGGLQINS